MNFRRRITLNIGIAVELLAFFRSNRRWWLQPMLIVLFLFAALIVLAQNSAIAPFIYALY